MFAAMVSCARPRAGWKASPALAFASAAGLAAFVLAAFAPAILNDSDTYWQIRSGLWMLAHGAVLRADPFSATMAGQAVSTQSWLAEILMATAWRAGGWTGIHILFASAAALTAFVVAAFVRARMAWLPALVTVVLGLALVAPSLLARPHMLALPLLAVWSAHLVRARERNEAPSPWLLPVMVLWVNLHGSFAFGLALTAALGGEAVLAGPRHRAAAWRWSLFLPAAIGAAMIAPDGWRALGFPFRLTGMAGLAHIGEWQASILAGPSPLLLTLLAVMAVCATGRVRVPRSRALILLALTYLALAHARHQMLLGVTGTLLLTPALATVWPQGADRQGAKTSPLPAIALGLLLLSATALRLMLPVTRGQDGVSPQQALAHVPAALRARPVVNDYAFGGYLIWNGIRPFIDSRADLYGDAALAGYAAITRPDKKALGATLARANARWTIFRADAPVAALMDTMPGWRRLYADRHAVVHVRGNIAP